MLRKLQIQNYAIIEEIDIHFSEGLNIITGETGAGKSILMGALSLILGDRADSSVLVHRDKKCLIEGTFQVNNKKTVNDFLEAANLDVEDELVLRREIGSNGKSRAFINGTPATLQQLRSLASLLVDLHQQFDTLELGDTDFQREVMDALAGNDALLADYTFSYRQWLDSVKRLTALQEQKAAFTKEADYHQFLLNELLEAGFKQQELEELDQELLLLNHAEGIKTALSRVYHELKEKEQPIVPALKQLCNQLQSFAQMQPALPAVLARLQSAQIELEDIASEIDGIHNAVQYDEKKIEWINQRLAEGYKLFKKHGVKTTAELLETQSALAKKLEAVWNIDEAIANTEKETAQNFNTAETLAAKISAARKKQIAPFEKKVNQLLVQVGMPNARISVDLQTTRMHAFGTDAIEFLFDANVPAGQQTKSTRFEPLRKVASGGELSRLMLCIKSLVAESIDLATLIFDEIDTGISGEAARQVGLILQQLAQNRQIMCITHQPQIAGKAHAHFFVYKEIIGEAIKTNIRLLNSDERIHTIAKMLSGEKPTAAALENAREMMRN